MATTPKFRIDVDIHNLLMNSSREPVRPAAVKGALPEPLFPQYPERLTNPGPEIAPEKRDWTLSDVYRTMRGWLFPIYGPHAFGEGRLKSGFGGLHIESNQRLMYTSEWASPQKCRAPVAFAASEFQR